MWTSLNGDSRARLAVYILIAEPDAIGEGIGYAKFYSRSHNAVIRVFDEAGSVIETHEHAGEFKER